VIKQKARAWTEKGVEKDRVEKKRKKEEREEEGGVDLINRETNKQTNKQANKITLFLFLSLRTYVTRLVSR